MRADEMGELYNEAAIMIRNVVTVGPPLTREEQRQKASQRYARQRVLHKPNLSSPQSIIRSKQIAITDAKIHAAQMQFIEQEQAKGDRELAEQPRRDAREAKRQQELAEQQALLNSLGLEMNPTYAAQLLKEEEVVEQNEAPAFSVSSSSARRNRAPPGSPPPSPTSPAPPSTQLTTGTSLEIIQSVSDHPIERAHAYLQRALQGLTRAQ